MDTVDVIKFLYEKEYRHIKPLGKGSFSKVLSAISPAKENVAVKIVKYEDSWHIEEWIWPRLNHKNVLPLMEMIDIEYLNVKLFVMPRMPVVLSQMLVSDSFLDDQNGLQRVKQWLSDTLEGLEYLHTSGFAHLDVKTNNVLISEDDHALLCDFSGLDYIGVPLETLCVPLEYSPPESYDALRCKDMEGSQCDIWLCGLMILNVLTNNWPSRRMRTVTDAESWKTNVEHVLLEALEESRFLRIMRLSFPAVCIFEEELLSAHDFVISMMRWDPDKRPSVQQIRRHPFLTVTESRETNCEERSKPIEPEKFVTNPFLEGWIDPETSENKTSFRNIKTESVEKDSLQFVNTDVQSVETNTSEDGCVDSEANGVKMQKPDTKLEIMEKMVKLNCCSSQELENSGLILETGEKNLPANGEMEKPNRFARVMLKFDDHLEIAHASKQRKKRLRSIILWFRKIWNQIFKKKNKYELLTKDRDL